MGYSIADFEEAVANIKLQREGIDLYFLHHDR